MEAGVKPVTHAPSTASKFGDRTVSWQPIETAPKDGTIIDLWIVGHDDTVDFYAPQAKKVARKPLRYGRAADYRWAHKPPNAPNWYPVSGLGYPLPIDICATHWMHTPGAPKTHTARPADKIAGGLNEALRVVRLVNACADVAGFDITEKQASAVLDVVDAS